jgi:hypothetical protein
MKVDKKIDEYLNESSIKSVFKYTKLDRETRKKINDLEKMLSNSDVDISKKLIEIIEDVYQDGYNEGGRDNRDL